MLNRDVAAVINGSVRRSMMDWRDSGRLASASVLGAQIAASAQFGGGDSVCATTLDAGEA